MCGCEKVLCVDVRGLCVGVCERFVCGCVRKVCVWVFEEGLCLGL